jgi:hypothetical protein
MSWKLSGGRKKSADVDERGGGGVVTDLMVEVRVDIVEKVGSGTARSRHRAVR